MSPRIPIYPWNEINHVTKSVKEDDADSDEDDDYCNVDENNYDDDNEGVCGVDVDIDIANEITLIMEAWLV